VRTRGHFPTDDAATKLLYLCLNRAAAEWKKDLAIIKLAKEITDIMPAPLNTVRTLTLAIQNWLVATSLLGAGAEHLSADLKQMLASLLVQLGSIIVHRVTEELLLVDFAEVKQRLQDDPATFESFKSLNGDKDDKSIRKFIGELVDILECSLFGDVVRHVLHQLCEGARQRVLATSVEKAVVTGPIESIIHAAWLTDIESHRGKDRLMASIKQLPPLPFLRSLVAAHFLARVYWNHWRKEDRHVLLNAAAETVKDVGLSINKGELMRYIDNSRDNAPSASGR
jgi:hypothetical protein